jgi:hypothetical protein
VTREELLTDWRRRLPSAAFVLLERDIDALIAAAKAEEREACERRLLAVSRNNHCAGPDCGRWSCDCKCPGCVKVTPP